MVLLRLMALATLSSQTQSLLSYVALCSAKHNSIASCFWDWGSATLVPRFRHLASSLGGRCHPQPLIKLQHSIASLSGKRDPAFISADAFGTQLNCGVGVPPPAKDKLQDEVLFQLGIDKVDT